MTAEAATEPPPEEEAAPEEGAGPALSFSAATYTNTDPAFSVQYPDNWSELASVVADDPAGETVAAFGIPAFIPGCSITVADLDTPVADQTEDGFIAAYEESGANTGVALESFSKTTLPDGTPAIEAKVTFFNEGAGYDMVSYQISAEKDDKSVGVSVWTIDMFSPYDEALFSEIAHTLTFE